MWKILPTDRMKKLSYFCSCCNTVGHRVENCRKFYSYRQAPLNGEINGERHTPNSRVKQTLARNLNQQRPRDICDNQQWKISANVPQQQHVLMEVAGSRIQQQQLNNKVINKPTVVATMSMESENSKEGDVNKEAPQNGRGANSEASDDSMIHKA